MNNKIGHSRLPDVYHFNPTCEYAIANGNVSWQPNRLLQKMEADLASLPMFLAQRTDYILVNQAPDVDFLDLIGRLLPDVPDFIRSNDSVQDKFLGGISRLSPWGWSPAEHHKLRHLKPLCKESFQQSPVFNWQTHHKKYYSKLFASEILFQLLNVCPNTAYLPLEMKAQSCRSQSEIEKRMEDWDMVMVKSPWSSSGRGLQPIRRKPVHEKVWEKVNGIIREQGYVMVEPYHDKLLDLALQFCMENGKMEYLGTSNFYTDYKGQYNGNHLNGLPENMDSELKDFVESMKPVIIENLIQVIESSGLPLAFEGYFGVDCLFYRDSAGNFKVNPCMEINLRYNMGLLSLQIEKMVFPGKKGLFRTHYVPGQSFHDFQEKMKRSHPLQISDNRVESGFLSLVSSNEDTLFGAYLLVED